jgi:hypothetical protein
LAVCCKHVIRSTKKITHVVDWQKPHLSSESNPSHLRETIITSLSNIRNFHFDDVLG